VIDGRRGTALIALMACVLSAATATAASASVRPRADLRVARGALKLDGARVTGTVVVHNAGRRRAPRTSVSIVVRSGGRDRAAGRVGVSPLAAGASKTVRVRLRAPAGTRLPATARACADARKVVRERSEGNNCRGLGRVSAAKAAPASPAPPPSPATPTPAPVPPPSQLIDGGPVVVPTPPVSSVPTAPISYVPDKPFQLEDNSWLVVPSSYDKTHQTPTELFVWLNGCYGQPGDDIKVVAPQSDGAYVAVAVSGRENDCWNPDTDQGRVIDAIAIVKKHFNIDPKRVVLGGYSSGGDLSYRLAFDHALEFAGVLALNTSPFKDTGKGQAELLDEAAYKFHVVHLAHIGDEAYNIDQVRQETDAMYAAGFPIARVERPGLHHDANTFPDVQAYLLPHLSDGWRAP
jgi:hypothetical protein